MDFCSVGTTRKQGQGTSAQKGFVNHSLMLFRLTDTQERTHTNTKKDKNVNVFYAFAELCIENTLLGKAVRSC